MEAWMGKKVGLVGIGLVGTALSETLRASGFEVIGFDPREERRRALESLGGRAALSLKDVVGQVECLILSLPDSEAVAEVVEAPGGILSFPSPVQFILDTTTGDPEKTEVLAIRLETKGIRFLDATLSGSSDQVRRREGVFMIGGEREAFEACRPLFRVLAEKFFYIGPSGSGSKAKLASNLILGLNRLVLAEGLVFAEKLGLDLPAFLELVKETPAYSRAMDVKGKKMVEGDFTAHSKIAQHHKDLTLIIDYASRAGQPLPLAGVHKEILEQVIARGKGDLDNAAVIEEYRRMGPR
jgi:3-hydroxyisobutyrate dehydrogenase-like beta-hydroxyacid dehydrogenase